MFLFLCVVCIPIRENIDPRRIVPGRENVLIVWRVTDRDEAGQSTRLKLSVRAWVRGLVVAAHLLLPAIESGCASAAGELRFPQGSRRLCLSSAASFSFFLIALQRATRVASDPSQDPGYGSGSGSGSGPGYYY